MGVSGGIKPSDNSLFYYRILDVGGVNNDVSDVQKHFFNPTNPEPTPISIDIDGDGVEEEFRIPNHDIDSGFYLEPEDIGDDGFNERFPNGIDHDPGFYLDPNKEAREAAQLHNSTEFQKAVQFAEENGITAVLVELDPGMAAVSLNTTPEVMYLDADGNRIAPPGAPELEFHNSSGQSGFGLGGLDLDDFGLGGDGRSVEPSEAVPAQPGGMDAAPVVPEGRAAVPVEPDNRAWDKFSLGAPDFGIQPLPYTYSTPLDSPAIVEMLNNLEEPAQTWDYNGGVRLAVTEMEWGGSVISDGFTEFGAGGNASFRTAEAEQALLQNGPEAAPTDVSVKVNL